MNIYIIGPTRVSPTVNPGGHLITYGIKWLLSHVCPEARVRDIDLYERDAAWGIVTREPGMIILAGHPRYSINRSKEYWDLGVHIDIEHAIERGVCSYVDAWAGGDYRWPIPKSIDDMAEQCLKLERVKHIVEVQRQSRMCIARDKLAEAIMLRANVPCVRLPCCSWFAYRYLGMSEQPKRYHAITVKALEQKEWMLRAIWARQRELAEERPCYVVTHSKECYYWLRQFHQPWKNLLCLYSPDDLLRFYSHVDKLISMRVHATIPALALGARVCHLWFDARYLTVDEFGIRGRPFTDLNQPVSALPFDRTACQRPSARPAMSLLYEAIYDHDDLRKRLLRPVPCGACEDAPLVQDAGDA